LGIETKIDNKIMSIQGQLEQSMSSLNTISLKELDSLKLLNRVDTKFVFNIDVLPSILAEIENDYEVLMIGERKIFQYESLYFDTKNFDHYLAHHNGKPNRIKVRFRKYTDSGDVYFEIKKRVKDSRTDKHRIKLDEIHSSLNGAETSLMKSLKLSSENLENKIWINYNRITLASRSTKERVTIDLNLTFDTNIKKKIFPNIIVAEIKQDKFSRVSKFVSVLRKYNIPEFRISKYAIAIAMMEEGIKSNAFKEKINRLNKISK